MSPRTTARTKLSQFYAMVGKEELIPAGLGDMTMLKAYDTMLGETTDRQADGSYAYVLLYICDRLADEGTYRLPRTVARDIIHGVIQGGMSDAAEAFMLVLDHAADTDGCDALLKSALDIYIEELRERRSRQCEVLPSVFSLLKACCMSQRAFQLSSTLSAHIAVSAANMTYQKRPEDCRSRCLLGALRKLTLNGLAITHYGHHGIARPIAESMYRQYASSAQRATDMEAISVLRKHGNPFRTLNMTESKR